MNLSRRLSVTFTFLLAALTAIGGATAGGARIRVSSTAVVSVREAHGVVVRHVGVSSDFVSGATLVELMLGHTVSAGRWGFSISGTACSASPGASCGLGSPGSGTVTGRGGAVRGTIEVTGAWTALATGNVTRVDTRLGTCHETSSARDCATHTGTYGSLTSNTLGSPVSVTHGQVVNVSVTITIG